MGKYKKGEIIELQGECTYYCVAGHMPILEAKQKLGLHYGYELEDIPELEALYGHWIPDSSEEYRTILHLYKKSGKGKFPIMYAEGSNYQ